MDQRTGLRELARFFNSLARHRTTDVLFRGHESLTWQLIPSAFRPNVTGIDSEAKLAAWIRASARFATPRPQNDIEWLVLAQHYGVATPLLDWTTSPLIALFFSCLGSDSEDGAVWQVRRGEFIESRNLLMIETFKSQRTQPFLFDTVGLNPRTSAQDSCMSLHTRGDHVAMSRRARIVFEARVHSRLTFEQR